MGLFDIFFRKKKKKARARTTTVTKTGKKRRKKKEPEEHIALKEWKTELKRIQSHPLTQAKIVNEQLLQSVMNLLNEINTKLNELNIRIDRIEAKQDKTIKRARAEPKKKKPEAKLSSQEERILAYTKAQKIVQAGPIARKLKISRSNASLKLNKLYSIGYLDKRQDGKDVHYSLRK